MRKRFKIPLWFIGIVLLIIVGLYLYLRNSNFIRNRVSSAVNSALSARYPLRLEIDVLHGDYLTGFTASGVTLIFDDGDISTAIASCQDLTVQYRLTDLWRGQWVIEYLRIVKPRIQLPVDSAGNRVWPAPYKEGEGGGFTLIDFVVEQVDIENGAFDWSSKPSPLDLDSIYLNLNIRMESGAVFADISPSTLKLRNGMDLGILGSGRYQDNTWAIDSAIVRTPLSTFKLKGDTTGFQLDSLRLQLDELSKLIGVNLNGTIDFAGTVRPFDKPISGSGVISGVFEDRQLDSVALDFSVNGPIVTISRLRGRIAKALFDGRGGLDLSEAPERYQYTGNVSQFNLENLLPGTLPTRMSGRVAMQGSGLNEESLTIDMDVHLRHGMFDDFEFDSIAGPLTVTANDVRFHEGFTAWHRTTRMAATGRIGYDDTLDVLVDMETEDLSPYDKYVFVDSLSGSGRAFCYWYGPVDVPNLSGVLELDSIRTFELIGDHAQFHFDITRFLEDDRHGSIEGYWGPSDLWGWRADSLTVVGTIDGHDVFFDTLAVRFPEWEGHTAGWLNWQSDTIPIVLTPLTVNWDSLTFVADSTVRFVVDSTGFRFQRCWISCPLGSAQFKGRFGYDESLDAQIQFTDFQFDRYWDRMFPDQPLTGRLSLDASLSGTLESPVITAFGRAHSLEYEGGTIGSLIGPINYADRRLTTDGITWAHEDFFLNAAGYFPIDLAFAERDQRVLSLPQKLDVTGNGNSLNLIARFIPDVVESIQGRFTVDVNLAGTPEQPTFSGWAAMTHGQIKALEVIDPIENADIRLRFVADTVRLEHASAVIKHNGHTGKLTASGSLLVLDPTTFDYNLSIKGVDVPVDMEFKDYFLRTSFDMKVTGATPPLMTGDIRIIRAEDREEFTSDDRAALPDSSAWDWDFQVAAPGNYWIRNSNLDAEFSLDLRMQRIDGILGFLGTAEVIRGKLLFYDRTGTIDRGTVIFDDLSIPYPQLDIAATFRIDRHLSSAERETGGRLEPIQLTVLVTGRANEPRIAPEPPYTEEDMLALLTAGATASQLFSSGESLYLDRMRLAGLDLAFKEALGHLRGIWSGDISVTASSNIKDAQFLIGTYAGPNLYLYGASTFDPGREQNLGFEYRLGRRFYLEGRRDSGYREQSDLYRLELHVNWEF